MIEAQIKKTKFACYFTQLAMSVIFSFPPLLFTAFHEIYDISYTMLGALVLINFCTQLGIDLIFGFFSKHFDVHKTVKVMPMITAVGLCIYALIPMLLPQYAYAGMVVGTVIFSVSAGLGEVLISPTVAALPSETPDRDMSTLHSLYAYGFVSVVLISTVVLRIVGYEYWYYLTFFWALFPVVASLLLLGCRLPEMNIEPITSSKVKVKGRTRGLLLCMACIFLGACAECTMSSWISVYAETVLEMPKIWGDILGMSLFAILLGLARTAYGKFGRRIWNVLLISMIASTVCYIAAALLLGTATSLIFCVLLGVSTAMLWPGTLIFMEENIPAVGVAAYAIMAAGGDLGASIAPQGLGVIVDLASLSKWAENLGVRFSLSAEQIGFRFGMLLAAIFPLLGVVLLLLMRRYFKKYSLRRADEIETK